MRCDAMACQTNSAIRQNNSPSVLGNARAKAKLWAYSGAVNQSWPDV